MKPEPPTQTVTPFPDGSMRVHRHITVSSQGEADLYNALDRNIKRRGIEVVMADVIRGTAKGAEKMEKALEARTSETAADWHDSPAAAYREAPRGTKFAKPAVGYAPVNDEVGIYDIRHDWLAFVPRDWIFATEEFPLKKEYGWRRVYTKRGSELGVLVVRIAGEAAFAPRHPDNGRRTELAAEAYREAPRIGDTVVNEHGAGQSYVGARADLLDSRAMLRLCEVLDHGANKYGVESWRRISQEDHVNHALLHLFAGLQRSFAYNPSPDEYIDDDLGNAFTRLMFALALREEKRMGQTVPTEVPHYHYYVGDFPGSPKGSFTETDASGKALTRMPKKENEDGDADTE